MNTRFATGQHRGQVRHQILRRMAVVIYLLLATFHATAAEHQAGSDDLELTTTKLEVGPYQFAVQLPAGLNLEVVNLEMKKPRMLTFAKDGSLWVGSAAGALFRLEPPYVEASLVSTHDDYPHGVAFRDNEIFLATTSALLKAPLQSGPINSWQTVAAIPGGRGHNSRTVRVGPDRRVYLGLGISGNCSIEYLHDSFPTNDRRGGVMVLDESTDPPLWRTFASGLRNPIGFDWHPRSGVMFASNNGPDHHGFDTPREVFARLDANSFHGMPWYQWDGKEHVRDECARASPPRGPEHVAVPAATFPARSAPMAVAFARESDLGGQFAGDAVVAIHGSWATRPRGDGGGDPATRRAPRLALVRFHSGKALRVDDLLLGFQLEDGRRWARPVGAAFGPDGALYFSSDGGIEGLFRLSLKP